MNINIVKIVFLCLCISLFYSCQNNTDNTRSEKQNEVVKVNKVKSNKENTLALLMRPNSLELNPGKLSNLEKIRGFRSLQLGKKIDELYFPAGWYSNFPYQNIDSIVEYGAELGKPIKIEDVTFNNVVLTFLNSTLVQIEFEPSTLNEDFINQYINLYNKPNVKNEIQFYYKKMNEGDSYNSQFYSKRYTSKVECENAISKITPEKILMIWQYKNIRYTIEQRFEYKASKNYIRNRYNTGAAQFGDVMNHWAIEGIKIANTIKIELIDEMRQIEKIDLTLSKAREVESRKRKDSIDQKVLNSL